MADTKISADMTVTPTGADFIPILQAGANKKATLASVVTLGSLLKAETIISGSDVTSYTFSGLDGNTDGGYVLVVELLPVNTSTNTISIRFNGDASSTGYKQQYLVAFATTAYIASTDNFAKLGDMSTTQTVLFGTANITRIGGYGVIQGQTMRLDALINYVSIAKYSATITNITSITVVGDVANGIKIGSILRLYKRK